MKKEIENKTKQNQTLAYRLRQGDKLWIGGHFVQLVKVPLFDQKTTCQICGFERKCPSAVVGVCYELQPDDTYRYAVGLIKQQNEKQEIVEPKA